MLEELVKIEKEISHRLLKIIRWHWKKILIGWVVRVKGLLSSSFRGIRMILTLSESSLLATPQTKSLLTIHQPNKLQYTLPKYLNVTYPTTSRLPYPVKIQV